MSESKTGGQQKGKFIEQSDFAVYFVTMHSILTKQITIAGKTNSSPGYKHTSKLQFL